MQQIVTTGIVLGRTNFGEADRIVTLLTPDQGKLRLIAKGARRQASKLAGGIELFSISQITYIKGRGEIGTLVSSRLSTHFSRIAEDINRTMYGYETLKRLQQLTEDAADEDYFVLLSRVLESLDEPDLPTTYIDLWQHLRLLSLAGIAPNLHEDTSGGRLQPGQRFQFDSETMGFSAHPEGRFTDAHIKLLRLTERLDSPLLLLQVLGISEVLPDALQLVLLISRQSRA